MIAFGRPARTGQCASRSRGRVAAGEMRVEAVDRFDEIALRFAADAVRVAHVVNGIAFGVKGHSLVFARQEAVVPLASGDGLPLPSPSEVRTTYPGRSDERLPRP